MNTRKQLESMEKQILSPFAQLSQKSKGRAKKEEECNIRTKFQRDRDRIIHSKAFRRLKEKTQVFISPEGDHYRTRLTHTLEVSQIARTIARALRLNEDLTEAIALGHDLGHTPFGHTGERVLNSLSIHGFRHNEQSLRTVEVLEKGKGLNLTFEVKEGILKHTGTEIPSTLEGQIVRFADRIAYLNHDIDDAIRARVISLRSLPKESIYILGEASSDRINNMIMNIIKNSTDTNCIKMTVEYQQATDELRKFMFDNVYIESLAKRDEIKAEKVVGELFMHIKNNPKFLPIEYGMMLKFYDLDKVVSDYIAGMTDRYAIKKFTDIFIPSSWF